MCTTCSDMYYVYCVLLQRPLPQSCCHSAREGIPPRRRAVWLARQWLVLVSADSAPPGASLSIRPVLVSAQLSTPLPLLLPLLLLPLLLLPLLLLPLLLLPLLLLPPLLLPLPSPLLLMPPAAASAVVVAVAAATLPAQRGKLHTLDVPNRDSLANVATLRANSAAPNRVTRTSPYLPNIYSFLH